LPPRIARVALRTVGGIVLACAGFGLLYSGVGVYAVATGALETVPYEQPLPYLYQAFYAFSAACVACYVALVICGVQFLRLSTSLIWLFVAALAVEVAVYLLTAQLWAHPAYGPSVAAATGISQGGLVPQYLVLLPVWAPALVWMARRSLKSRSLAT
jgi:hypothetical protein